MALREQEERTKEELEEEKKRKKRQKEEESTPEMTTKKSEIERGMEKGMAFGEAKPLTEIKYVKVPIKEVEKAEKYEPIVKEELAVRLQEEERKKEEQETQKELETKGKGTNAPIASVPQQVQKERERVLEGEKVRREAIRKEQREQYQKLHKELDETIKKGISNPLEHIAQNLLKQELAKGAKKPASNVIRTLRIAGLLQKKKVGEMKEFLKNLIPKMA